MSENSLPLVSFVIPTFNRAHILKECLESVVNQTYKNIEVIVVNDGSTDNTEEILEYYCREYVFFRYYNNKQKGSNAARNYGIQESRGDYIAFMDDDDICEPFRIAEQIKPIIESDFAYNFIVSGFCTFTHKDEILQNINYLEPFDSIGFPQRWLIKKEIILKTSMFDVQQPALQDVEFYWRIKEVSNIMFIPKPVVRIRITNVSITKDNNKMIQGISRLIELHGSKMNKNERNIWLLTLCKKYAFKDEWTNYFHYYRSLDKLRFPLSSMLLFIAFIFRSINLLKLHTKAYGLYFKFNSYLKWKINNVSVSFSL